MPQSTIPAVEAGRVAVPELIAIPAGSFLMGSTTGQDNEQPVHCVEVGAFQLASTQVTNSEYAAFLNATGHPEPPQWGHPDFSHPAQPVVAVSWFDAVAYCGWLSAQTALRFRLPTEAEWEYAARAGHSVDFPWGNDAPQSRPNYAARWQRGPEPVRTGYCNSFGLWEMCENVHEWCSDWFSPDYYAASTARGPRGPAEGTRRSSRGGSWRHHIKIARCAARSSIPPEFKYADYGFRVAAG